MILIIFSGKMLMMCALELLPRLTPGSARVNIVKTMRCGLLPGGAMFHDTNDQHFIFKGWIYNRSQNLNIFSTTGTAGNEKVHGYMSGTASTTY